MSELKIKKENVKQLLDTKFIKVYDLEYEQGQHYYDATRREKDGILATMSDECFKKAIPDGVSCAVVLRVEGEEEKLCVMKEYRYPTGHFLLSIPAGLIDEADQQADVPAFEAAFREIEEETGVAYQPECDEITLVNPLLFASPGLTDESTAFVKVTLNRTSVPEFSQNGAVGSELFDGIRWITKEEARHILKQGCDAEGIFYSAITWIALMTFVTDIW